MDAMNFASGPGYEGIAQRGAELSFFQAYPRNEALDFIGDMRLP
jgi:hypothetical protein